MLGVSVGSLPFPEEMPPPPGMSKGYPLQITINATLYGVTVLAMVGLAMLASAGVARRTVGRPVVEALGYV